MSLVGYRPEQPDIAQSYEAVIPEFAYRLKVKAGLSEYAQVYGKYYTYPLINLSLIFITSKTIRYCSISKLIYIH